MKPERTAIMFNIYVCVFDVTCFLSYLVVGALPERRRRKSRPESGSRRPEVAALPVLGRGADDARAGKVSGLTTKKHVALRLNL